MTGSIPHDASVSDLFKGHLTRIFPETAPDTIQKAAGALSTVEFVEGQIVIQEGARSQGVLILLAGRLGIFTRDSNGHTTLIRVVADTGALIGEQSARQERHFTNATVIALTPVRAALISPDLFRDLLASDRKAAERLNEAGKTQALEKLHALSAELSDATRVTDAGSMTPRQFPAGATIYQAGEPSNVAFLCSLGRSIFTPQDVLCPMKPLAQGSSSASGR